MSLDDDFSSTVGLIYDAAVDPAQWQDVLRAIADLVRAETGLLAVGSHRYPSAGIGLPLAVGIDPEHQRLWVESFHDGDVWWRAFSQRLDEEVLTAAQCVDPGDLQRTPIYNELFVRAGVEDGLFASIARLPDPEAVTAFHRSRRRERFGREEVESLSRVLPHLRRAVRINDLLGLAESQRDASLAVAGSIPIGWIQLGARGRFLRANALAQRRLTAGDRLTVRSGRLRATVHADDLALSAAIARASESTPRIASAMALAATSVVLYVTPVPRQIERPDLVDPGSGAEVVVLIASPESDAQWPAREAARLLGLTLAEAELVLALARGDDLEAYAAQRGIGLGTARWRMKRILSKKGCRRQSEVVRLVLTTLGRLAPMNGSSDSSN